MSTRMLDLPGMNLRPPPAPEPRQRSLLMVTTVPVTLKAFLLPLARHFRSQGWRVDAMAREVSGSPECLGAFDRCWDVSWSRNPLDPRNLFGAVRTLREVVARERYDLVHVHTPVAGFVTRLALRNRAGAPRVVYTAHGFHFYRGGPALRNAVFRKLEKMAGRWTDSLVVMNREDEAAARVHGIVPPGRLHYMDGIGVDTTVYRPGAIPASDVARLREELKIPSTADLFVMIAELIPRKRPADVLEALARMTNRRAHLLVAGTGPLQEDLERLARERAIADRVHFLGFRRDVPLLLRASRAMILASEHEGLPRSVMEGMCMETPVIGSRIRGIIDLLEDGCGLLVDKGDPAGLARAMESILAHPDRARAMVLRARSKMNRYDVRNILRLHEELYRDALAPQAS